MSGFLAHGAEAVGSVGGLAGVVAAVRQLLGVKSEIRGTDANATKTSAESGTIYLEQTKEAGEYAAAQVLLLRRATAELDAALDRQSRYRRQCIDEDGRQLFENVRPRLLHTLTGTTPPA